jgi:phage tail sheath gpL-like
MQACGVESKAKLIFKQLLSNIEENGATIEEVRVEIARMEEGKSSPDIGAGIAEA